MTSMIEETSPSTAAVNEPPRTPTRPLSLWTHLDVAWSPLLRPPLLIPQPTTTTAPTPGANTALATLADTEVQHLLALTAKRDV
jgi:hypothetical protein